MEKKVNSRLELVSAKGKLKKQIGMNQAFNEIMSIINNYGDISTLEKDKAVLHDVCNRVENSTSVKLNGDEKKELAIRVMTALYPALNNDRDVETLKSDIDWVCSLNKVVKKVGVWKRVKKVGWAIIKKNLWL